MIYGTSQVGRIIEESVCRSSKNYRFTDVGMFMIHATTLMPEIPFGAAAIVPEEIDSSIFINDDETKSIFPVTTNCQNYLTTKYIGRAPLEYYKDGEYTTMGREFILKCWYGITNDEYRVFGTESAIRGYSMNDSTSYPDAGEKYSNGKSITGSNGSGLDPYSSI